MEHSETIGELAGALSLSQGEMLDPVADESATIPGKEGKSGYSYKYSDLAGYLKAARPVLSKNGLAIVQPVSSTGNSVTVTTTLLHKSGEWIREALTMAASGTPQAVGGVITYARRYSLASMLGLATEDDDAAAATHIQPQGDARRAHDAGSTSTYGRAAESKEPAPLDPSNPGAFVMPWGKYGPKDGKPGKALQDVPARYLREFVIEKSDDAEVVEAATMYLASIVGEPELRVLQRAADLAAPAVDSVKVAAQIAKQHKPVTQKWFTAALSVVEQAVTKKFGADRWSAIWAEANMAEDGGEAPTDAALAAEAAAPSIYGMDGIDDAPRNVEAEADDAEQALRDLLGCA